MSRHAEDQAKATAAVMSPIDAIEHAYDFRQQDEVRDFLARHTNLLDVLVEASARIPQYIPASRRIVLEVLRDPDDDDAEGELFAVVPTALEPEEVLPRLARMRRDWWIAAARQAHGWFNIDVEYV